MTLMTLAPGRRMALGQWEPPPCISAIASPGGACTDDTTVA